MSAPLFPPHQHCQLPRGYLAARGVGIDGPQIIPIWLSMSKAQDGENLQEVRGGVV